MSEPSPSAVDDDVLVAFLLDQCGLLDVVLTEHVDDGSGCCRACPGPRSGRHRFPCDVRLLAERAARIRTARAIQHRRAPDDPTP